MFIMEMPPAPSSELPIIMTQAGNGKKGGVVMQDLTPLPQTLIEGEELMFIMDVPYVPAQETPIVLAQANAAGATAQPDYILKDCKEYQEDAEPESALHGIDPSYALANALNSQTDKQVVFDRTSIKNITLLETTKHGKLEQRTAPNGIIYFMYYSEPDFLGDDQASIMAEFEGKRYKIVVNIKVLKYIDDYNPVCSEPKLIKVKKPSTGSSGYDMGSISVTFADLDGGAIGLTNASGITLDTNAANYNWFIDPTPADNSERIGVRSCINTLQALQLTAAK